MKPLVVVDTNVPIVANGPKKALSESPEPVCTTPESKALEACVTECVKYLKGFGADNRRLALDDRWRIIGEYKHKLRQSGQPGVGDAFLKWVLNNWNNPDRCELVPITPVDNPEGSFAEFPSDPALASFDPSDRKFVAVSLAHPQRPPIVQATDTKWWSQRNELQASGVTVEFLCPDYMRRMCDS